MYSSWLDLPPHACASTSWRHVAFLAMLSPVRRSLFAMTAQQASNVHGRQGKEGTQSGPVCLSSSLEYPGDPLEVPSAELLTKSENL